MGIWEEYCLICGGPLNDEFTLYDEETQEETQITKKEYKWMYQLFLLTNDNKIIKTTYNNYELSGEFEIGTTSYVVTPIHYGSTDNYGVICHQDCYHLIHKKLKHEIVFANVCRMLDKYNNTLKPKSKYKPMDKFIQQFYEYDLITKNHSWLLESPLVNKQNQERILKIWTPLVTRFKKNPPRNSPCESATDFHPDIVKKGFDGNDWIVKTYNGVKKWVLYDPDKDVKVEPENLRKSRRQFRKRGSKRPSRRRRSRKASNRKSKRKSRRSSKK